VNGKNHASWPHCVLLVPCIAICAIAGCRTHTSVKAETAKTDASNKFTLSAPIGGTYCLTSIEQGPPVSQKLHFSYKKSASDGSSKDFEGDLLGDTFDSTVRERHKATDMDRELNNVKGATPIPIVDGFAENVRQNHFTRTDASGWSMGANGAVQGFTPWGLFISKPPVKEVGTEKVAGFDTVKFDVDTSQQSQLEKSPMTLMGGLKDYSIKGNAWLEKSQQCILQYSIDYEEDGKDGTVTKTHYEGSTAQQ
jgi:hypothetical protein